MESDHRRTQAELDRTKSQISDLRRSVNDIEQRTQGLGTILTVVPTGIDGWGDQIIVLGKKIGAVTLTSSVDHMWKVTQISETDGVPKFSVLGGIVVIQGTRVEVADVAELTGNSQGGNIYLKVTRNSASRAYDSLYPPEIVFSDSSSPLVSDELNQYTVLAEVVGTGEGYEINQCRNDEICSQEIVITDNNGASALLPVQGNSRNSYAPPSTSSAAHPWQVRANGDNTVAVAPGCLIGFSPTTAVDTGADTLLNLPMVAQYISYAGGNVTVTAATGFIYVSFSVNYDANAEESINLSEHIYTGYIYRPTAVISVYFSETAPDALAPVDSYVHMPIAAVTLAASIAGVGLQVLTHNPVIQLDSIIIDDHAG